MKAFGNGVPGEGTVEISKPSKNKSTKGADALVNSLSSSRPLLNEIHPKKQSLVCIINGELPNNPYEHTR